LIGKEKKDPGVAIFSPRVFDTGAVCRGDAVKSLTMRLTNFYDATFQKGHQLAVIGTGGGLRTSKSAERKGFFFLPCGKAPKFDGDR
jgi:hypothetical protein